jgi:EAL domain-containing protein (putative c-di-GMP-specific phosphodiesterase class I)
LRVAVNISAAELARSDFVERVVAPLHRHGLVPDALEIEVTERMLVDDNPAAVARLERLRQHGVRISIDDFGTRYSSLSYLQRLSIRTLKIDQSFVRDLVPGSAVSPVIQALVGIARGFDLQLVAEGVETDHQLQCLQALGCHEMQGYLLGAPMPAAELSALLVAPQRAAWSVAR